MKYLEISPQGEILTFEGDFPDLEREMMFKSTERLAWVAPVWCTRLWILARKICDFLGLKVFSEALKALPGPWVVVVDGKKIATFPSRKEALRFERDFFLSKMT